MSVLSRTNVPMIPRKREGGTSDKTAPLGTFSRLENLVQDAETGRFRKRKGSARLTALASGTGGWLATRESELIASDGTRLYAWDPAAQAPVQKGRVDTHLPYVTTHARVQNEIDIVHVPDFGLTFHFYVALTGGNSSIRYSVLNADGGYVVNDAAVVAAGGINYRGVRAVRYDNMVLVFYKEEGSGNEHLYCRKIGAGTPSTVSAAVQIDSDATGVNFFDVQTVARGGAIYSTDIDIAWQPNSSLRTIRFRRLDPHTMTLRPDAIDVLPATITWDIDLGINFIPEPSNVGNVILGTTSSTGGVRLVATNIGFTISTTVTVDATASAQWRAVTGAPGPVSSDGPIHIFAERIDSTTPSNSFVTHYRYDVGLASVTNVRTKRSVQLASRAWTSAVDPRNPTTSDNVFCCVGYASSLQPYVGVYDWTNDRLVTRMIEDQWFSTAFASELWKSNLADTALRADGVRLAAVRRRTTSPTVGTIGLIVQYTQIELDPTPLLSPPKEAGGSLYVPGGVVRVYDGSTFVEAGFHIYPETPVANGAPGAGGLAAGTYRMRATYAWTDANGVEHESVPSLSVSFTVGAAASQQFNIATYRITDRTNVKIRLWRTTVNPATDPDYYLENETDNNTAADTVTMTCTTADATLSAQRTLYVRGDESVLENLPPPATPALEVYGERLWALDAQTRRRVWPSKVFEDGFGVAWNDTIIQTFNTAGDLTAIGSLGDKLLAFKERAIFAIWGDGPDNTGNGQFSSPWEFTDNTYGTDRPLVARTKFGILFRATGDKGWRVATSGLGVEFFGADVEDLTGFTPTAITLTDDFLRIGHSEGTVFTYDFVHACWYTETNRRVTGACMYNGRWTYIDTAGVIRYEVDRYDDDGVPVVPAWETTWVALNGIGGYGRLYAINLLGARLGTHRLRLRMQVNYGQDVRQEWAYDPEATEAGEEFAASSVYAGVVFSGQSVDGRSRYEFRTKLKNQRVDAIKLRGEEYYPDDVVTAGFALEAISFDVGIEPGRARQPTAYSKR